MEPTKNLCAQIPVSLHAKVREEQERSGQPLGAYITDLLTEYYNRSEKSMEYTKTLAFQIPEELFLQLKEYLQKHGLKQKEFVIGLIQQALAEDKAQTEE